MLIRPCFSPSLYSVKRKKKLVALRACGAVVLCHQYCFGFVRNESKSHFSAFISV